MTNTVDLHRHLRLIDLVAFYEVGSTDGVKDLGHVRAPSLGHVAVELGQR